MIRSRRPLRQRLGRSLVRSAGACPAGFHAARRREGPELRCEPDAVTGDGDPVGRVPVAVPVEQLRTGPRPAAAHPLSQRLAFRAAFALGWTASTGQLALRMT
jgi:hypothetical protein